MRLNGRELTQQEVLICKDDFKAGGKAITKKYKLDQGGEHPVVTKKTWEGAMQRIGNPEAKMPYRQWVFFRLGTIAHAPESPK